MDLLQSGIRRGSRSSLRLRYVAEVEVLKRDLGSLEEVRSQMGLSRRKMCELLLVDPSAWTRWSKEESKVPPHIWKMLSLLSDRQKEASVINQALLDPIFEELRKTRKKMRLMGALAAAATFISFSSLLYSFIT